MIDRKRPPEVKLDKGEAAGDEEEQQDRCSDVEENERELEKEEVEEQNEQDEEDDYMKMHIPDDSHLQSGLQSKRRKTQVDQDSAAEVLPKGFAMMSKMGFKLGGTLGRGGESALREPISINRSRGHGGIRVSRPLASHSDSSSINEDAYKHQIRAEKQRAENLSTLRRMQKMAFELSGDVERFSELSDPRNFNCLWRRYVMNLDEKWSHKEDEEKSSFISQKAEEFHATDADSSLLSGPPDRGQSDPLYNTLHSSDGSKEEDKELQIYEGLTLDQQVLGIQTHLRTEYFYCFYCGAQFSSEEELFGNCPGPSKEDHI
ncbi:LADA_0F05160g1_1 [Lachancea dasiensis]|uniref:LADA_0F05160g1_1 n=1 Tax=Lachancea dasiensis TaxID=1072105 RepID=A0A1G4JK22_9SACH|nr:LADA_0F05160g1_1 [Lachancea dasiensis]